MRRIPATITQSSFSTGLLFARLIMNTALQTIRFRSILVSGTAAGLRLMENAIIILIKYTINGTVSASVVATRHHLVLQSALNRSRSALQLTFIRTILHLMLLLTSFLSS